jgi:hypothetical protein
MTAEEKIKKESIVKKYLQGLFSGCDVQTKWDFNSNDLLFRIDGNEGKIKHRGKITYELLDDIATENIAAELDKRRLRSLLAKAGRNGVLISSLKEI